MPYASLEAVNLVERLCSWDPNNRPTAAQALQHPFFQSCYYVPPSLRAKSSVGQRGSLEHQQQSFKRLPATLTNTANYKPFNSYANAKANGPPFGACQTQRNLETAWNNKTMGSYHVRDAKYIPPPGRKSPSIGSFLVGHQRLRINWQMQWLAGEDGVRVKGNNNRL